MAKLSISRVLETRRKIRILTVLASFLVVFMLLQGFVFNNPKNSLAGVNEDGDQITLSNGNFMVENGYLYATNAIGYIEKVTSEDLTVKTIVVDTGAKLVFAGSETNMDTLKVKNGGVVTHVNLGQAKNKVQVREDFMGVMINGWFKASDAKSAHFSSEAHSRVLVWDREGNRVQESLREDRDSATNYYFSDNLVSGSWYRFEAYYTAADRSDFFHLYNQGAVPFPIENINADGPDVNDASANGTVYTKYFYDNYANEFSACYAANNAMANPALSIQNCFNFNNLKSPTFKRSLFVTEEREINCRQVCHGVPPFQECDQICDFETVTSYQGLLFSGDTPKDYDMGSQENRGITLNLNGGFVVESGGVVDLYGKGYRGGVCVNEDDNRCNKIGGGPGGGGVTDGRNAGGGGSHGGRGGWGDHTEQSNYASPGVVNDDTIDPKEAGSGGGSSGGDWEEIPGGAGGGIIVVISVSVLVGGEGSSVKSSAYNG